MMALVQVLIAAVLIPFAFATPSVSIRISDFTTGSGIHLPESKNGRCGAGTGFGCGPKRCCSIRGFCGITKYHCGDGCQSAFGSCGSFTLETLTVSPDFRCGVEAGFKCAPGHCCSQYNYCGTTPNHCEFGCQSAFGICDPIRVPESPKPVAKNGRCGSGTVFGCEPGYCCSKHGFCGATKKHCGVGCQSAFGLCDSTRVPGSPQPKSKNGKCGSGTNFGCGLEKCCSKRGFCGTTKKHCGVGCQSAFGLCKAVRPPVG
ncbi:hypothetical protein BASA50_003520 [Batrachochytrium salamandrivorans]|uniref:Chitin-binding type-1 domain-containing protein n=1 Tax=Batrachochytrium salamandrivorans TaxID=1357716 RepID=A0ABQ8FKH5_9FUNG|nr:hypothetical protein BASA62_003819 [Batrachochytrium salamandrivorans]KAH6572158.1 hypothetical protein BASA60_006770 [Batrachochytrium salamandrivorans]KAH6597748.1 hypothetical protein BASA61_003055 [Batrachochytrium salamandrivorans]KAH6598480.1 hypothetical protein BASA50_003520 [Batrachochytrium salamandrivorans]KAH9276430.1 hypothetical protein BASA83_001126 [Batrachochytrium salamandrivorans]